MGSKVSKPAQSATRKFPSRAPGTSAPPSRPPRPAAAQPRSDGRASFTKSDAIKADSMDPDTNPLTNPAFSQRLRQMGVAVPNPTLSNSSTASPFPKQQGPHIFPSPEQNPTLSALEARKHFEESADLEFQNMGQGREFLDVGTLKQALILQAQGTPAADIEKRLRLKSGVVKRLGPRGVTSPLVAGDVL